ncbi:MAG TPA: conjugal transfer protein TraG [Aurantimonas coralicida]|uniref:Conjugal transfer protein TraG n=2 Tax=root TaxID=1 RepID=A0A9C9TIC6_9HYPH|nr:conjugal transfer protein TraG [Aurantimonas coralicida]HEU02222.1 conjugal transfer protein TraG [Aurantimonas coralicida]
MLSTRSTPTSGRAGAGAAPSSFNGARAGTRTAPATLLRELTATLAALRRSAEAQRRAEAWRARMDTRDWAKARRDRTRHLIELGGLVQKAGLVELTGDDRGAMLGAFLDLAGMLKTEQPNTPSRAEVLAHWRRQGRAAFEADEATTTTNDAEER